MKVLRIIAIVFSLLLLWAMIDALKSLADTTQKRRCFDIDVRVVPDTYPFAASQHIKGSICEKFE